jgi:hypothetical protein
MPTHWTEQLQNLIDLAHDRIRLLDSGEMSTGDIGPPAVDSTRQTIEAERAMIMRLQQTIDALNRTVSISCPVLVGAKRSR